MGENLHGRRPLICLVTDRRSRGAAKGSGLSGTAEAKANRRGLVGQVEAAVGAGVDLVQIREPDLPAAALLDIAELCVRISRGTDTVVVVNERADVALAAGAHGVHLRASSLAASALRRWVPPGFLIGRSVHGVGDVLADVHRGADYLIAGTLFPSRSKPAGHPLLGLAGLSAIIGATNVPVLAIGGISVREVEAIASVGAAGIAGIDLFAGPTVQALADGVRQIREAFQAASRTQA